MFTQDSILSQFRSIIYTYIKRIIIRRTWHVVKPYDLIARAIICHTMTKTHCSLSCIIRVRISHQTTQDIQTASKTQIMWTFIYLYTYISNFGSSSRWLSSAQNNNHRICWSPNKTYFLAWTMKNIVTMNLRKNVLKCELIQVPFAGFPLYTSEEYATSVPMTICVN